MANKVAVVTGSNRGIGYGIVRELCRRGVGVVYLTARNVDQGKEAVENLKKEGFDPIFHQLDLSDQNSVKKLADHLKEKHDGFDILINNAGVITNDFLNTVYDDAKRVIDVNYRTLFTIEEYLFPILKQNGRVINVSSDAGHISNIRNSYWIKRISDERATAEDVNAFVDWFLDSVKNGTLKEDDFAEMSILAYRISKVAMCALTVVQQRKVGRGISVNSLHPGFVKTGMTRGAGFMTLEESGVTPAFIALDVDQSVKGKYFWFDKTEKDWADPKLNLHSKFEVFGKHLKEIGAL